MSAAEKKLSADEKTVLVALYEASHDEPPSPAAIGETINMSEAKVLMTLNALYAKGMVDKPQLAELALSVVDDALRKADENIRLDTPARVLMASIIIGSGDEDRIVRLGLPADDVRVIGDRLRSNGVWDAGGVDEPETDHDFFVLCAIAEGLLERQFDRDRKEWMLRNTDAGMKRAEDLIRKSK